ncbi:MAG: hypothetical protein JSU73_13150 [candidate division WOR-3 bacterium]|nr:MAG: hypothetical protein JSU73_13150 [candidate division WOR-3 bacterium]
MSARAAGRKSPVNAVVFVIAGAVMLIALVAAIILLPKAGREAQNKAKMAEEERVRDSVRRANRERMSQTREDKKVDRLTAELEKLESRYLAVKGQVVGKQPSAEQQRLVNQIQGELARLKAMAQRANSMTEEKRKPYADTIRIGERQVRSLISDLSRSGKTK